MALTLEQAATEYKLASDQLSTMLVEVERMRIATEMRTGTCIPRIDSALVFLQGVHRYDALRGLMNAMETYVESMVTLQLNAHPEARAYAAVVEDVVKDEPAYLPPR